LPGPGAYNSSPKAALEIKQSPAIAKIGKASREVQWTKYGA